MKYVGNGVRPKGWSMYTIHKLPVFVELLCTVQCISTHLCFNKKKYLNDGQSDDLNKSAVII